MIGDYLTIGNDDAYVAYRAPDGTWIGHVTRSDCTCEAMAWTDNGRPVVLSNKRDRLRLNSSIETSGVEIERLHAMEGK